MAEWLQSVAELRDYADAFVQAKITGRRWSKMSCISSFLHLKQTIEQSNETDLFFIFLIGVKNNQEIEAYIREQTIRDIFWEEHESLFPPVVPSQPAGVTLPPLLLLRLLPLF